MYTMGKINSRLISCPEQEINLKNRVLLLLNWRLILAHPVSSEIKSHY
jgi:hypothetical protein